LSGWKALTVGGVLDELGLGSEKSWCHIDETNDDDVLVLCAAVAVSNVTQVGSNWLVS